MDTFLLAILIIALKYSWMYVSEASASESEDDNERVDAAEEDTDDEENTFFDTRDFLSSSSFKSSGSDFRTSSFSSDDDDLYAYASDESVDPIIRSAGTKFPYVKRRKKLPNPIEKEKGVSLWSMIKDNIGKDLTKVCLPVYFNEPLSSLQKSFEDLEYSYLLDRASEWGRRVSRQVLFTFWIDLLGLFRVICPMLIKLVHFHCVTIIWGILLMRSSAG